MSNFNSMLKEFAEAQQAIEQVPILRDEVRAKHEENRRLESARTKLTESLEQAQDDIANLRAKIARLEVERDDASFREMATADKLDALQSKIGALVDLAQELKPTPEPEPLVKAHEFEPEPAPSTEGEAPTETQTSAPQTEDSSASDPIGSAHTGTFQSTYTGGDREVYHTPPKYEDQATFRGQSIDTPDVIGTKPADSDTSSIDPSLGFMKPTSKPYAGLRPWSKPNDVSWDNFVSGGGEAPSWYVKPTEPNPSSSS